MRQLFALLLLALAGSVHAETRDFIVYIDGKPSGHYQLSIQANRDGAVVATGSAAVRVTFGRIPIYRYSYRGVEIWKANRLQRLDSITDDNGRQYQILAVAEKDRLRVGVNGHEHAAPVAAWTTSYWFLPIPDDRKGDMALLDCDTGRVLGARLGFIGVEQMHMNGQLVKVRHFRVTGAASIDLWYDNDDRLIHQESIESGHKTSLQINSITP